MRIAAVLAGFSMGQADVLRKAMGKKDPKVMAKQREAFIEGARANGVNEKKANKIFDLMEFFAGYGFNKSHSTAYALGRVSDGVPQGQLPVAFHGGAADDRGAEHRQARDVPRGVPRPRHPDAAAGHQPEPAARSPSSPGAACGSGSRAVKSVGEGAILSILGVRRARGRIDSLCRAVRGCSTCASSTSACSRASSRRAPSTRCGRTRRPLAACAPARGCSPAVDKATRARRPRTSATATRAQTELFGGARRRRPARPPAIPLPDAPAWTETQQLAGEKEALGLYMSGHPIDRYDATALDRRLRSPRRVRRAAPASGRADVWIGGIVSGLRPLKTQEGRPHGVFMLDDAAGSVEVVVFPETFEKHGTLIETDAMVLVAGKFERDDESARLLATEMLPIAALEERHDAQVAIHLPRRRTADHVRGARPSCSPAPRRPARAPRARRAAEAARHHCASGSDVARSCGCGRPSGWWPRSNRLCGAGIGGASLTWIRDARLRPAPSCPFEMPACH